MYKSIFILKLTISFFKYINISNPYISKDLSIFRYSVPEFIKSKENIMKKIKKIEEASLEDGGEGAFYLYLKN